MPSPPSFPATLSWTDGHGPHERTLANRLTIGRSPENDIVVEGPDVSRRHCVVVPREGFVEVDARQSTNGVEANGQRTTHLKLFPGNSFSLGGVLFEIRAGSTGTSSGVSVQSLQLEWSAGGKQHRLPVRGTITIGRAPGNKIVLNDPGVSREHCSITQVNGVLQIDARSSTNGIVVDGRAQPSATVAAGNGFSVGSTGFRVTAVAGTDSRSQAVSAKRALKPAQLGTLAGAASLGVLVVLVVAAIALTGGGDQGTDMVSQHVTAAEGGIVAMPGGPTVTFPPGALDRDTTVTIRESQSAPASDGHSLGSVYEIDAGESVLVEPAILRVPFDRSRVESDLNSNTVALAYFDQVTRRWINVASALDSSGDSVVYATEHFSDWQVQAIKSGASVKFALPYDKSNVSVKYVGGPHQWAKRPYCSADSGLTSGVDFGAGGQEFKVLTIASGTVVAMNFQTEDTSGPGFWVTIEHDGGIQSSYWHLRKERGGLPPLGIGQEVPEGFPVGFASNSGDSTMSKHAHVELSEGIPEGSTSPYGTRVSWNGRQMDEWTFWLYEGLAKPGTAYSYQGSATRGAPRGMEILISGDAGCGLSTTKVRAQVGPDYRGAQASGSSDDCALNAGASGDTAFACDDGRGLHLPSSNCERHVRGGGCVDGSSPPLPTPEPSKTPPPVSPTDPVGQVPPSPSQASIRAIDKNTVEVSWKAASNNHTGFRVYGTGGTFLMEASASFTSVRINGFSPGEQVCVNVRAFNSAGESGNAYAGCATTPKDPVAQAPAAPSQASIEAIDKNTVEVSWKAASNNHTGFRVYGTGGTFLMEASASFTSVRINGFSPGEQVCVNVRAFNSAGESGNTYAGCATTPEDPAAQVPAAPSSVRVQEVWCVVSPCPGPSVHWDDNSTNESGFRVYANGVLLITLGANATSVDVGDDVSAGQVCFSVSAFNSAGESVRAGNACLERAVDYSLSLDLNDLPDGHTFTIGEGISLCYWLTPSNVPYGVRLFKSTNGSQYELISQWTDTGGGDCIDSTVGSPAGTRTYLAQAVVNGAVVAEDTTWIQVTGAQSYSFSGTLAGTVGHVGPGDTALVQWTSPNSPMQLCYHLTPENVPFTVRISITRGTYYLNQWQGVGSIEDNGVGGGGCLDIASKLVSAWPSGACYGTLKVEAVIQGTTVGEINFSINRQFGC